MGRTTITQEAEGTLIGGNLSTPLSMLGAAYDCTRTAEPYILSLEDIDENPQHIHRYLTALMHLTVLDRAQGIVFGEWTGVPREPTVARPARSTT